MQLGRVLIIELYHMTGILGIRIRIHAYQRENHMTALARAIRDNECCYAVARAQLAGPRP